MPETQPICLRDPPSNFMNSGQRPVPSLYQGPGDSVTQPWDGLLSPQQFQESAQHFVESWQQLMQQLPLQHNSSPLAQCTIASSMLQAHWQLQHVEPPSALFQAESKCCMVMQDLPHTRPHQEPASVSCESTQGQISPVDQAHSTSLPVPSAAGADAAHVSSNSMHGCVIHLYSLRVILHPVYQVPTLYLSARNTDGSPVTWQDMEGDFPHWQQLRSQLGDSAWALMAPADDQVPRSLHSLMLHPCRTAAVMQLLLIPGAPQDDVAQQDMGDMDRHGVDGVEYFGHGQGHPMHKHGQPRTECYLAAWLQAVVAPVLKLRIDPEHAATVLQP